MNELAKWALMVLVMVMYMGMWAFVVMGALLLIMLLLHIFKPEWFKKLFQM